MATPLAFSVAAPDEYLSIAEIWDASWRSTGVGSPEHLSVEQLADRLRKMVLDGAVLYSVKHDGTLIGLILLIEADRRLSQVFLAPGQQGLGFGRNCLDFVKQQLPNGFWLSVAEANHGAVRFYQRNDLIQESRFWREAYQRHDLRFVWSPMA